MFSLPVNRANGRAIDSYRGLNPRVSPYASALSIKGRLVFP